MQMSISRCLNELTLLDARINRTIGDAKFVGLQVGKKQIEDHIPVQTFEERAKSSMQSATDLIARRNQIKSAITASNAVTVVEIAGKKMTVAEALDRKTSISYEQNLLSQLRAHYNLSTVNVTRENNNVKQRLDKHIETMLGNDTKGRENEVEILTKSFNDLNEAKVIDPLGAFTIIQKLTKDIEDFTNEVDISLNESNVCTLIEVSE